MKRRKRDTINGGFWESSDLGEWEDEGCWKECSGGGGERGGPLLLHPGTMMAFWVHLTSTIIFKVTCFFSFCLPFLGIRKPLVFGRRSKLKPGNQLWKLFTRRMASSFANYGMRAGFQIMVFYFQIFKSMHALKWNSTGHIMCLTMKRNYHIHFHSWWRIHRSHHTKFSLMVHLNKDRLIVHIPSFNVIHVYRLSTQWSSSYL